MSEFLKAIKDKREGVITNIMNSFGCEIKKSHIVDFLDNYESKSVFTVNKSGKEIKEKIVPILEKERIRLSELQTKLTLFRDKIDCEPTEHFSNYRYNQWKEVVGEMPKLYSYETCKEYSESSTNSTFPNEDTKEEFPQSKLKCDYNDLVHCFSGAKVDIAILETLITNIDDQKQYTLPISDASKLGF